MKRILQVAVAAALLVVSGPVAAKAQGDGSNCFWVGGLCGCALAQTCTTSIACIDGSCG